MTIRKAIAGERFADAEGQTPAPYVSGRHHKLYNFLDGKPRMRMERGKPLFVLFARVRTEGPCAARASARLAEQL